MHGPQRQDLEQQEVERALNKVRRFTHKECPRLPMTTITRQTVRRENRFLRRESGAATRERSLTVNLTFPRGSPILPSADDGNSQTTSRSPAGNARPVDTQNPSERPRTRVRHCAA